MSSRPGRIIREWSIGGHEPVAVGLAGRSQSRQRHHGRAAAGDHPPCQLTRRPCRTRTGSELSRLEAGLDALETGGRQRASVTTLASRALAPLIAIAVIVLIWQIIIWIQWQPDYIIPSPTQGLERAREPGDRGHPVAGHLQQHSPGCAGLHHRDRRRHADRLGTRPEQQAAPDLPPDPHRPAATAVGRVGPGRDHLVRTVRRHDLHGHPCSVPFPPSSIGLINGIDQIPAALPSCRTGPGGEGLQADLPHRAPRSLARLPRRPRAGLGVRLALADGRRAHRGLAPRLARAWARCSTPVAPSVTWPWCWARSR